MMDEAIRNFKSEKVSDPADLSDYMNRKEKEYEILFTAQMDSSNDLRLKIKSPALDPLVVESGSIMIETCDFRIVAHLSVAVEFAFIMS